MGNRPRPSLIRYQKTWTLFLNHRHGNRRRARAGKKDGKFFFFVLFWWSRREGILSTAPKCHTMYHHQLRQQPCLLPFQPTCPAGYWHWPGFFFSFLNCPFHFFSFPSFLLCNDTVSSDGQNVQQARKQYQRIVHPYSIRQIWLKSFRSSVVSNQWNRPNNKKKIDTATDNKRRWRLDLTVTVILALLF